MATPAFNPNQGYDLPAFDPNAAYNAAEESAPAAKPPGFWDTLQREGKALTGSIAGMPAAVYHAFSEPPTADEKQKFGGEEEVSGAKRIGLGIHRLATAPVENAVDWYSDALRGKIPNAYEQALSVAPEAIGSAAGNVVAGKAVESGIQTLTDMPVSKLTAPLRAGAKATNAVIRRAPEIAGGAAGGYLGYKTGIPEGGLVGALAGRTLAKQLIPDLPQLPEHIGLPSRVVGGETLQPEAAAPEVEATPAAATAEPAQPVTKPADTSPKNVERLLDEATGGKKLVPGVSLKNQAAAQSAAEGKLPEGFTPVESSVLKGYKYSPDTHEFESITNTGQHYVHGDVSPDQVAAFEDATSKGKAWTSAIRNNSPLVAKVVNGQRVPILKTAPVTDLAQQIKDSAEPSQAPTGKTLGNLPKDIKAAAKRTVVVDPATGQPEFSDVLEKKSATPAATAKAKPPVTETTAAEDLTELLKKSVDQAKAKKAATGAGSSTIARLVKGEAGQAGMPGSVTDADEGIAEIQNRPVISSKSGEVPARGFLRTVGADHNSILKTQKDLDSVFYHRQQIAKNGTPSVELHVDEDGNVIGAQGRHRALAAVQQGGANAKVKVTIYKHPSAAAGAGE